MAILTKEQFEKRNENAAKRNAENTNIAVENGLPREIGESLEWLCNRRHWFHSLAAEHGFNSEGTEFDAFYDFLRQNDENFKTLRDFFHTNIFEMDELAIDMLPCDADWFDVFDQKDKEYHNNDFNNFKQFTCEQISEIKERINGEIEKFLQSVDDKYNTHYKPTGNQRIY